MMSEKTDVKEQEEATEEKTAPQEPAGSLFFRKIDKDIWEAWTWTSVGLLATAAVVWLTAFLKLGYVSVLCWGVGIPLTAFMAVPIILWGLVKTMLNPPIFRPSRSIGFVSVLLVAYMANYPQFRAPVSTEAWQSDHTYSLPFEDAWYTVAGGDSLDTNYMGTAPAMRFGYVFTKLTEDGKRFHGDPLELPNYPCYGAPVLAPVAGEVMAVNTAQRDNVPGKPSTENMLGNYLVLRVDKQEDLILTSLKKDSITVKEGDRVERGQKVGECGNSGSATEPELRLYLVKDSKQLVITEGLPLEFSNYEVIGDDRIVRGVPTGSGNPDDLKSGQTVRAFNP
jgi:hypothetical protein